MRYIVTIQQLDDLNEFRGVARKLLAAGAAPEDVAWSSDVAGSLFGDPLPDGEKVTVVPRSFVDLSSAVICHRDEQRWLLLYQALWRIDHGEVGLMQQASDPLVHRLYQMAATVRRDQHRMTAFVRFRRVPDLDDEVFIAWYEPQHRVLRRTAPFFIDRFANMRFSILTPYLTMHWNRCVAQFCPGLAKGDAAPEDAVEDWWRRYYAAAFNPARVNAGLMQRHMPKLFWRNLPEAQTIPRLVDQAETRTDRMIQSSGFKAL